MSLIICLVQIESCIGDIKQNISNHIKWVNIAITNKANLIVFPELSLTGYEPKLAKKLALHVDDKVLNVFQDLSDLNAITIGLPLIVDNGICISMVIFQPFKSRSSYSKQILHADELPYFTHGKKSNIITINNINIALAICYESLQKKHINRAINNGGKLYIASVAKNENGIKKAMHYFPKAAKKNKIPILMVNNVGMNDNFKSIGTTSSWNESGEIVNQLKSSEENYLIIPL